MKTDQVLINRADLLEILSSSRDISPSFLAELLGYSVKNEVEHSEFQEPEPPINVVSGKDLFGNNMPDVALLGETGQRLESGPEYKPEFFYQKSHKLLNSDNQKLKVPAKYKEALPFSYDELISVKPEEHVDKTLLVPWSRLWPLLRFMLSSNCVSKQPDIEKTVNQIAKQKLTKKMPLKQKKTWASDALLVIEHSERLSPVREDIINLRQQLTALRGNNGLREVIVSDSALSDFRLEDLGSYIQKKCYQKMPVMILSDLGIYDKSGEVTKSWTEISKELNKKNIKASVLCPAPPSLINEKLSELFNIYSWDVSSKLKRITPITDRTNSEFDLEKLLMCVSVSLRSEMNVLRDLRLFLNEYSSDISHEFEVLQSDKTISNNLYALIKPELQSKYRKEFTEEFKSGKHTVFDVIDKHHRAMSLSIAMNEEVLRYEIEQNNDIESLLYRFVKTAQSGHIQNYNGLISWYKRIVQSLDTGVWQNEAFTAFFATAYKAELERDGTDLTYRLGIDLDKISWMNLKEGESKDRYLLQKGDKIKLLNHTPIKIFEDDVFEKGVFEDGTLEEHGSLIAKFKAGSFINIRTQDKTYLLTDLRKDYYFDITDIGSMHISTDTEELEIAMMNKPDWAYGIGRDSEGLFVQIKEEKNIRKAYWSLDPLLPNDWYQYFNYGKIKKENRGFWWDEEQSKHNVFFKNSRLFEVGKDQYGYFKEINIFNILVRFRWCPPGEFMMGSPEHEIGRNENEKQHEVILTRGFWLAETACTQELWEAVMGNNPAYCKGNNTPVDHVSYKDCHKFFDKVNYKLPELGLRLPSEAEWEYACRAGTTTPFNCGASITTDQANFDMINTSTHGSKKQKIKKTVPVKSFPCNNWGLYEMHGNVMEWCADSLKEDLTGYGYRYIVDPLVIGDWACVVRGGSWVNSRNFVRSAYRYSSSRFLRYSNIGFRFALGYMS